MVHIISLETFMQGFVYSCFFLLVLYAAYFMYEEITTQTERKRFRTRIQRELYKRKARLVLKSEETTLAVKLKNAGNPLGITAFRYQFLRWSVLLTLLIYYIAVPFVATFQVNLLVIALLFALFLFSSPHLRFSLPHYVLDQLIILRNKKKQQELFTLFDMLQAELTSLSEDQEINVFNLIRECVQYFDYIDTALIKFLHVWKYSPQSAKNTLAAEIGGEDAETLSNILFKIDETSKEQAIQILQGASQIFAATYFEGGNRKKEKRFVLLDAFFFSVNLLIIAWLLLIVVSMFTHLLDSTNF